MSTSDPAQVWSRVGFYAGLSGGGALVTANLVHWMAVGREMLPGPLHTILVGTLVVLIVCSWVALRVEARSSAYAAGYADGVAARPKDREVVALSHSRR